MAKNVFRRLFFPRKQPAFHPFNHLLIPAFEGKQIGFSLGALTHPRKRGLLRIHQRLKRQIPSHKLPFGRFAYLGLIIFPVKQQVNEVGIRQIADALEQGVKVHSLGFIQIYDKSGGQSVAQPPNSG